VSYLFVDTRDRYVAFYGGNPLLLLTQTFRFVRIIRTRAWMKRGFDTTEHKKALKRHTGEF
jgi:putative component of membrane protein insertase Oxa1/YidC/SpoIIIJ protein YidD